MLKLKQQSSGLLLAAFILHSSSSSALETAYDLVTKAFGKGSYEVPDSFHSKTDPFTHIQLVDNPDAGKSFAFYMHRDIDGDVATGKSDRQRCEIKVFDGSNAALKGTSGKTLSYTWKFNISDNVWPSSNFSHFFQLKFVGGNDGQPLVTFTGKRSSNSNMFFQILYNQSGSNLKTLKQIPWQSVAGQWINANVKAKFGKTGGYSFTLTNSRGETIVNIPWITANMWRTGASYVRPKWGIYRSLISKSELNPQTAVVLFNDFKILDANNNVLVSLKPSSAVE